MSRGQGRGRKRVKDIKKKELERERERERERKKKEELREIWKSDQIGNICRLKCVDIARSPKY